jgi:hypothetical protein
MESYVYDRLKAIYYGVNYSNLNEWPEGFVSFPGNILLSRLISKRTFNHFTDDQQPYSLFINVSCQTNIVSLFREIFEICPNLRDGFSDTPGFSSYVNSQCESVLRGLFNGKIYLDSKKSNGNKSENDLFQILEFDTDKYDGKFLKLGFPFINGIMHDDFKSWYFNIPDSESGVNALRFNESVYLGRAIGLSMSSNLDVLSNNMFMSAPRNYESDPFTKDEVYAVTGLKSELIPYSMDDIKKYLSIDTFRIQSQNLGGNSSTTP